GGIPIVDRRPHLATRPSRRLRCQREGRREWGQPAGPEPIVEEVEGQKRGPATALRPGVRPAPAVLARRARLARPEQLGAATGPLTRGRPGKHEGGTGVARRLEHYNRAFVIRSMRNLRMPAIAKTSRKTMRIGVNAIPVSSLRAMTIAAPATR